MSKERLTYKNHIEGEAYLKYGLAAKWEKMPRYNILNNAIQKLAEYEDLEDILRDKLTEEAVNVITASKKDFSEWLDRMLWINKKCDELAREVEQYRDLEEQGLLLRLPVAVGGAIWVLDRDEKPREMILDEPDIRCHCAKEDNLCVALCDRKNTGVCAYRFKNDGSDIGEKVFLTQSEAEEKLRELEGK